MKNYLKVITITALSSGILFLSGRTAELFSSDAVSPPKQNQVPLKIDTTSFVSLMEEVLEHNPELKLYEAEVLAAKGERKNAGLWSNPEVSSSFGRKKVTSTSEGEEGEGSRTSTEKGSAAEIVVTQSVPWPGRVRLRKAIADRDIELAQLSLEQFRDVLKARTKMAAYELSAAQERAEAAGEISDHFHTLREVLNQRDQAGLTPLLEMRMIEAIALNMQRKASQAMLEAQAALFDLNQLRGAEPSQAFQLGTMKLSFFPIRMDKNEMLELASTQDYSVRFKMIELERQGYQLRLARNERFPDITAGPMMEVERAGERERVIGAEVSLPFPLWDWNQGDVTIAKAKKMQAETSLKMAQSDAERKAVEGITTYETKLKEMENWKPDSIQHFKEAAELADRHYRLGSVPVSTYIELQSQYLEAIEGLQDTKKEALATATQLEMMTGQDLSLIEISLGEAS